MLITEIWTMLFDAVVRYCIVFFILGLFGKRSTPEARGIALLKGEEVIRTNHTIPGTVQLLFEPCHEETCFMPYANNKGSDQPAHPRSLISAFVVRCLYSIKPILVK